MWFLQPGALGVSGPPERDPCACTQHSFHRVHSLFLELKSGLVSCFLGTVGSKDKLVICFFFVKGM